MTNGSNNSPARIKTSQEGNLRGTSNHYTKPIRHLMGQIVNGVAILVVGGAALSMCTKGKIPGESDFKQVTLPADFPHVRSVKLVKIPTPGQLPVGSTEIESTGAPKKISFPTSQIVIEGGMYRQPNSYNTDNNTLSVYYQTNKVLLDRYDIKDLEAYLDILKSLKGGFPKSIVISSYADMRGTAEGNQKLSDGRNQGVHSYLQEYFRQNNLIVDVNLASFGSTKASVTQALGNPEVELAKDRRVDIYTSLDRFITEFMRASPADVYLVDGSLSMSTPIDKGSSKTRMNSVQEAEFKTGSDIYIFQSGPYIPVIGKANVDIRDKKLDLSFGGTPLYEALLLVIQQNPGKTITLISDGEGNTREFSEDVITYAKKYNCKVNIGAIQIPQDLQVYFQRLAGETGGRYAIIQE